MRFEVVFNSSNAQKTDKNTILATKIINICALKSIFETSATGIYSLQTVDSRFGGTNSADTVARIDFS